MNIDEYDKILGGIATSLLAGVLTSEIAKGAVIALVIIYYGLFVNPPIRQNDTE